MGLVHGRYDQGALAFILPVAYGLLISDITLHMGWSKTDIRKNIIMATSIVLIIVAFILTGILFEAWPYAWQLFLIIPVLGIIPIRSFRLVAISPFVATIIFFSVSYFFDLFRDLLARVSPDSDYGDSDRTVRLNKKDPPKTFVRGGISYHVFSFKRG